VHFAGTSSVTFLQPKFEGHPCAGKPDTAERKANAIIADLRAGKMSKAADIVEQTAQETLTYYACVLAVHFKRSRAH
jgi:hypothetical protein